VCDAANAGAFRVSTAAGFVGRRSELRILGERLAAAEMGQPQVVYVEGEPGGGKSTLLSRFLGSLADAVILQVGGDEAETLLSYGVIDQLQPGVLTEPGTDPLAVGVRLLDLFDRLQSGGQVVVLAIDDLQWVDRPSARAGVDWRAADAADPEAAADAAKGAAVIYQCLNAPYSQWPERFPPLQRGVLTAAERSGALLVSLENLYGYGPTGGQPMTEDLPLAATGV
jgi:AAA ATPase domain